VEKEHYIEYYHQWNFPFPMSKRDVAVSVWDFCGDTRAIIVSEDLKPEYPRQKGFVRMKASFGGFILEQSSENPEETILTHVQQADVGVR
jgi:hypothetical protein